MDLTTRLRRFAYARPSVLLLPAPTATGVRLAVERFVRENGWPTASGPADADVLVTAGTLRSDLATIADTLQTQLAPPCARISVTDPAQVPLSLRALPERLVHGGDARPDQRAPAEPPMAERSEGRDGLALDALRIPLGPVLPCWQPGLRLHVQLRGDVIDRAHVETLGLDTVTSSFWDASRASARALDSSARLFGVAGWRSAHSRCLALRDRLLNGDAAQGHGGDRFRTDIRRLARRARLLEPELRGLARVPRAGDAADRLRSWLAIAAGDEPATVTPDALSSARALDLLPELVIGTELGAARLAVASLDIDVVEAGSRAATGTVGAEHG